MAESSETETAAATPVERVQIGARIEKRMAKVLKGLAEFKGITLGELIEEIVFSANARILKYVPGAQITSAGPLLCIHYEKPLWWETDAFQVIDVEPGDVLEHIRAYRPGSHLIAVITTDPDAVIAPYAALG